MTICFRTLLCLWVLSIAVTRCTIEKPTQYGTVPLLSLYYPLAADNWWVSRRVRVEGDTTGIDTVRFEIIRKEQISGWASYVGVWQPARDTSWLVLSSDELRVYSHSPTDSSSYHVVLKLPLVVGDTWAYQPSENDGLFAYVASRTESVVVPAGRFTGCLKVEVKESTGEVVLTCDFAPNVGMVHSRKAGPSGWDSELLEYHVAEESIDWP